MDKGWIKLNRQIMDHWIWQDHEFTFAWIDLLLMVNHENKKILVDGKLKTIKRGQTLTSIGKLADRWGWSRNRVYRYLEALKRDSMVYTDGTPNGTTITIVNYSKFQGYGNSKQNASETTDGTADGTTHGTTDGTQTRKKKNEKNEKKKDPPSAVPDPVPDCDGHEPWLADWVVPDDFFDDVEAEEG